MSSVASPVRVRSTRWLIAISAAAQLLARVVHLLVNAVISLALIRYFDPQRYGDFVFVITVNGLLLLLSEFGMKNLAVRSVSQHPEDAGRSIGTTIAARLLTATLATVTAQLVCVAFSVNGTTRAAVSVMSILFFSDALLAVTVLFHVSLRQEYDALVRTVIELAELALILYMIRRGFGLVALSAAPVIGAVIGVALAVGIARNRFDFHPQVVWGDLRTMFHDAFPLAALGVAGAMFLKLDAFVVTALRPRADVGIYGAAFQPIEYALITTIVLINVLFPLLANAHGTDPALFAEIYHRGTEAMLILVLPILVLVAVIGHQLVDAVYRSRYAAAVWPMRILALALVFLVVNVWQGFALVASGRQNATLLPVGIAIVLNITIDIWLVARFGPIGAAVGTLLTSIFLAVCSSVAVQRNTSVGLRGVRFFRIGLCAVALTSTALCLHSAIGLAWWITAGLTCVAWISILQLAGVLAELRLRQLTGSQLTGSQPPGSQPPVLGQL